MNVRKRKWVTLFLIIVLASVAFVIDFPKGPDLQLRLGGIDINKELKVHLGLDLQGGTHLVYQADLSRVESDNYNEAIEGIRDVIEKRVNSLGVAEPLVQTNYADGQYRIIIELAGVYDIDQAREMIGRTPSLDFREVNENQPDFSDIKIEGEGEESKIIDGEGNELTLEDIQTMQDQAYVMTKLTGSQLQGAQVQFDQQTGEPIISLEFNSEGRDLFSEITGKNIGKPLAIFLDDELISSPTVQDQIKDGKAIISGQFSVEEAKQLAQELNAGALPVPISLISEQTIGPTLGKISIEKSFLAGLLGVVLVAIYMIVIYRLPGLLAVFALFIYSLLALAIFKLIPITMTLAGVAGFILSIGMAVDANVLIFERIKEELRKGKALSVATDEGFKYAWSSIRDSNLSTLITCFILAWFGTSLVKGFAITLGIGVVLSMFSAVFVTKTFMKLINTHYLENKLWFFGVRAINNKK